MELKLDIYDKKEVKKTYTAETYDIMFGTVEDLIDAIDFDKIQSGKNDELIAAVAKAIPKAFGLIKPLLKDIFDGLTDDEIKHCRVSDIAKVVVNVIKFAIVQVSVGASEKN